MAREAMLVITEGPLAKQRVYLQEGDTIVVGRGETATMPLPQDQWLSREHFRVHLTVHGLSLEDLGSRNGTIVNGQRVQGTIPLADRDRVEAGETIFQARIREKATTFKTFDGAATLPSEPAGDTPPLLALAAFKKSRRPLFAVLDQAGRPELIKILDANHAVVAPLLGKDYPLAHPVLVALHGQPKLLQTILEQGWAQRWGIFFDSDADPAKLRDHLRTLLSTADETGERFCFPFYDPVVLHIFLAAAGPDDLDQFFGPIARLYAETADPEVMLTYVVRGGRLMKMELELKAMAETTA